MWTCDADGTNCQQLTFFEGPQGGAPRWSPDGRWIAFDSRVEGKAQIYVIPSDGGKPRRVTGGDSQNMVPSWSRDGRWIYFDSDRSGEWRIWKSLRRGWFSRPSDTQLRRCGIRIGGRQVSLLHYHRERRRSALPNAGVRAGPRCRSRRRWSSGPASASQAKGVYFLSDSSTLQLLSAATGKITTVVAGKYAFGGRISRLAG